MAEQRTGQSAEQNAGKNHSEEPMKVWLLLDRSGSMRLLRRAVVAETNRLLDEQRKQEGGCRITLAQFDSRAPFELIIDDEPISGVRPLRKEDYAPRGGTPLFDAIGSLVARADERIRRRERDGQPEEDQTLIILTDGLENASREFTGAQIAALLDARKEMGWAIAYLGANQDALAEAGRIGVDRRSASNFRATDDGLSRAYSSMIRGISERRRMSRTARRSGSGDFFRGVREAEEPATTSTDGRSRDRGRRSRRRRG